MLSHGLVQQIHVLEIEWNSSQRNWFHTLGPEGGDMSGYIIYHYNILDPNRINELGPLSLRIIQQYGGEIFVASAVTQLEESPYSHMVVYKFQDAAAARAYYESEENQELAKFRKELTDGIAVFVPGYENQLNKDSLSN